MRFKHFHTAAPALSGAGGAGLLVRVGPGCTTFCSKSISMKNSILALNLNTIVQRKTEKRGSTFYNMSTRHQASLAAS